MKVDNGRLEEIQSEQLYGDCGIFVEIKRIRTVWVGHVQRTNVVSPLMFKDEKPLYHKTHIHICVYTHTHI